MSIKSNLRYCCGSAMLLLALGTCILGSTNAWAKSPRSIPSLPHTDPDCVILFCLAGGFPAGVRECTEAFLEMIHRITPFPIRSPIQACSKPSLASLRNQHPGIEVETLRHALSAMADVDYNDRTYAFLKQMEIVWVTYRTWESGPEGDKEYKGSHNIKYCDWQNSNCQTSYSFLGSYGETITAVVAARWFDAAGLTEIRPSGSSHHFGSGRGVNLIYYDYHGRKNSTGWIFY